MNEEIEELKKTIENLQSVHSHHIKKLTELHEIELTTLRRKTLQLQIESTTLEAEKTELEGTVEGMRVEVEMLRQSFDLVQGRLKRVLVDQDDLVRLIQLMEQNYKNSTDNSLDSASKNITANGTKNITDTNKATKIHHTNKQNHPSSSSTTFISKIESFLKSQEQNESTISALQSVKYFRKLESSDPVHLCRLLDVSFCPDRSFSLSNSLLASISLHMAEDSVVVRSFEGFPVYPMLLNEIVRLRQEINDLCRSFLSLNNSKTNNLKIEMAKRIEDKSEKGLISISRWLIEKQEQFNVEDNGASILSSFLSKFK